jgi:hypothetical protein
MNTWMTCNDNKIDSVIRILRSENCRAWEETYNNRRVICTDASLALIAFCSGDGLWATKLFCGLP